MAGRLLRNLARLLALLLAVYAAALVALFVVMRQPPDRFGRIMARVPGPAFMVIPFRPLWTVARAGDLQVGDEAPDFSLRTADRKGRVQLSSFRGNQPVVLVFGSYTWPPFRREVPALNKLYQQHRDRAAFFVVYIREAHPSDAWQLPVNVRDEVVYASPTSATAREDLANVCVVKLGIEFPAIVDDFDDTTDTAYSGWPDRLYLIDTDGQIAYKSKPGPYGFKPDELERALAALE